VRSKPWSVPRCRACGHGSVLRGRWHGLIGAGDAIGREGWTWLGLSCLRNRHCCPSLWLVWQRALRWITALAVGKNLALMWPWLRWMRPWQSPCVRTWCLCCKVLLLR